MRIGAQPDNFALHEILIDAYLHNGMEKQAARELESSLQLVAMSEFVPGVKRAFQHGGYNAVLEWELRYFSKRAPTEYVSALGFATLYARLQQKDKAL